ncbi:MAG: class A beta-lactamase-related serine hydrolase [Patescibacteria group bacterium]|nr:class A beta-lactamase-related serine hydrolase [Patescibacteria group bacterium]
MNHRRRKSFSKAFVIFFILLISFLIVWSRQKRFNATNTVVNSSPKNESVAVPQSLMSFPSKPPSSPPEGQSLDEVMNQALEGADGTYGLAVENLKTGETFYRNEHTAFEVGSLYKLWVMAVVYQKIDSGILSESQILSQDIATLNQEFWIDPGFAEQTEGSISVSVDDALTQMITVSANYPALLLSEKIGLSSVAQFLNDYGFRESAVGITGGPPTTTAADIALFFKKLYRGELSSESSGSKMIALLKKKELNDGLPKYLPDPSQVANKTGDIDLFMNDGGIVYAPKGDYIIVILSQTDYPTLAEERIAQISKSVYEYFTD